METVIRRARIEINFETQYGSYLSSYQSLKLRQNNIYATPYYDKESRLSLSFFITLNALILTRQRSPLSNVLARTLCLWLSSHVSIMLMGMYATH